MDNVVYCSECHRMFFDVEARMCHICREGTLLDITHLIKNAAQQSVQRTGLTAEQELQSAIVDAKIKAYSDLNTPRR